MKISERTISIKDINTHYFEAGEKGSTVVLLHGGGTDSAHLSWGGVMGPLAEAGHRVIAPDLPGYGGTDRPDILYNTAFYLDFIKAFLDELKVKKASMMGLSMGGGLSLGFTLENPERVEKLVLVDSYGIQRKVAMHLLSWMMVKTPGIMEYMWKLERKSPAMLRWAMSNVVHDPKQLSQDLMDEVTRDANKPHSERAFTSYQRDEVFINGLKTVYIDRLHEVKVPTLLVHGEFDTAVPLTCAEEAHQRIAGSKLEIIPGTGHWPQREKPAEFEKVVTNFLQD